MYNREGTSKGDKTIIGHLAPRVVSAYITQYRDSSRRLVHV